ncbi:hypothetical protein ColTof3_07977 [Colletotrichum tofieldiae]|nr:hypothetical protein ColTof3_07977 [Colletotrichum tofieldiae]
MNAQLAPRLHTRNYQARLEPVLFDLPVHLAALAPCYLRRRDLEPPGHPGLEHSRWIVLLYRFAHPPYVLLVAAPQQILRAIAVVKYRNSTLPPSGSAYALI